MFQTQIKDLRIMANALLYCRMKDRRYHIRLIILTGSAMLADLVITQAAEYYRMRILLDCGHSLTKYPETWMLDFHVGFYRTGVGVYCNRCEGRPERTCTAVFIDGNRMAWDTVTRACGRVRRFERRASEPIPDYASDDCAPHPYSKLCAITSIETAI